MKIENSELNSSAQSTLRVDDAERVDVLPEDEEGMPLSKFYEPLSFPVIALLMAPAVFGVLARLGLVALTTYNGESDFPLAYVQALGCLIMGFCLRLKEPLGQLYVLLYNAHTNLLITKAGSYAPLYTALTTGFSFPNLKPESVSFNLTRILWLLNHIFELAIGCIQRLDQCRSVSAWWT